MARSNSIKRRFRFPNTEGIMGFLPDGVRNHIVATIAELAGTFLFLFFALSIAQVANTPAPKAGSLPSTSNLLFIALGFGCSVAVNVWIFYRVSGGMFNPAV
jgi:aquaporin related protein